MAANDIDDIPRCPKCGEPARYAIVRNATVSCDLNADGSIGKVLQVLQRGKEIISFRCGGYHEFTKEGSNLP